jgi:hypothetical protein
MLCCAYDVKAEIHEYAGDLDKLEKGMSMKGSNIPSPFPARPLQDGLWVDCATTQRQGLYQTPLIYFLFLACDLQCR